MASEDAKDGLTKAMVDLLKVGKTIASTYQWSIENNADHLAVVGMVKSLEAKGIAKITQNEFSEIKLTALGQQVVALGSPEARIFHALESKQIPQDECAALIKVEPDIAKAAVANALKLGYLQIVKNPAPLVCRKAATIVDSTQEQCKDIAAGKVLDKKVVDPLRKRNFLEVKNVKEYTVIAGDKIADFGKVYQTDLNEAMIASGDWKTAEFKPYNFNALGVRPSGGNLHPLMKIRQEFREIFFELGFEEMPSNRYVESSFWNFDALFQPQFHPTRDAHDTFFVKDPAATLTLPEDYLLEVKAVHENGGKTGSTGHKFPWARAEAEKNILRTHTTAVSARVLYELAQEYKKTGVFKPKKFFSIERVFRNEATDATHLAEFHQVEGVIADYNITLQDLIGVLTSYFEKQGLTDLQLKPAFNPYTEPSMEIFGFHKGLNKLVELGNSGMFRPEMLEVMGLPPNVRVLGWGVSLERPAMIKYQIKDIRTLIGAGVPFDFISDTPLCRLDKD